MQIQKKDYDPKEHNIYRVLSMKQPYAQNIIDGITSIEIRSERCSYRGDVLLCSLNSPEVQGLQSGAMLGFIELYQTKDVRLFTEQDWQATRIPREKRKEVRNGVGWFFKNPRKVTELPVRTKKGLDVLYFTKDTITEYPREIKITDKDWNKINKYIDEHGKENSVP